MSTGTTTPSSRSLNIARYTQAISSNLSNLMGELARARALAASSNDAILSQLQIVTEQFTKLNERLPALEQATRKPLEHTEAVAPLELVDTWSMLTLPTAEYAAIVWKL